jgi:hypothetical protein
LSLWISAASGASFARAGAAWAPGRSGPSGGTGDVERIEALEHVDGGPLPMPPTELAVDLSDTGVHFRNMLITLRFFNGPRSEHLSIDNHVGTY